MNFYLTFSSAGVLGCSPFPDMDRPMDRYLYPGMPLGAAKRILNDLNKTKVKRMNTDELGRTVARLAGIDRWEWRSGESFPGRKGKELFLLDWEFFSQQLCGHQLLDDELALCGKAWGLEKEKSLRFVHHLVMENKGEWIPAVRRRRWGWECERCGNREPEEWPGLRGNEATCPRCAALGRCSSLQVIYRDCRAVPRAKGYINYSPHQILTPAQVLAAQKVMDFYLHPADREALLWAACGAGKTEVCFPIIDKALEEGKAVLLAAPRQDVIYDIAPRLRGDFPQIQIQVLTGAEQRKLQSGPLVAATTHQILRFYQAFDLVILDEMDAFPYEGNEMLRRGLQNSLKPGGKLLYLTSTPAREILKKARKGNIGLITLPARHHRHPLPVPVWQKADHTLNVHSSVKKLKSTLDRLKTSGPVIVFVPLIQWVEPWVLALRAEYGEQAVEGSYSSDENRRQKVKELKELKWEIFVSTSILERGVTVPGAQVMVVGADHAVFDEKSLVQMAGRAGRTKELPGGQVYYFSARQTPAIKTAIRWICEQNKEALAKGLIDSL